MELICSVQKYAWGKVGETSAVATLAKDGNSAFNLEQSSPYAELWMGTHPNGPSKLAGSGQLLKEYLDENPVALGEAVSKKFGKKLPFLFKVLSVNKALSIQAHPDKQLAEKLHKERPDIYKDDNHKPEMIIALTDFEALCDFRPFSEIKDSIANVPQLANCIGPDWESFSLRECFTSLMKAGKDLVQRELASLEAIVASQASKSYLDELFLRLYRQYPGDVGCFVIYFLTYHKLKPGEALFLKANVPHAYLSGDGVECMADSDNVVRSGLTPKYIDTDTLSSMLTYDAPETGAENRNKVEPVPVGNHGSLYVPGTPDFTVVVFTIEANQSLELPLRDGPSILLVVAGASGVFTAKNSRKEVFNEGPIHRGKVFFLSAGDSIHVAGQDDSVKIFQAFVEA